MLHQPAVKETVVQAWNHQQRNSQLLVSDRLKSCRRSLSKWKRNNNLNAKEKIQQIEVALEFEQSEMCPRFQRIDYLKKELLKAYKDEESYWRQRSREFWLRGGDKNTRFFHDSVKYRRARKRLEKLMDEHGVYQKSEAAMGQVASDYFNKLFTSLKPDNFEEFFQGFNPRVTDAMNEALITEVTNDEVKEAVFSVKPDSSPGPDGMSGLFFQHYWPTIGDQVTAEVKAFFLNGVMPTDWNYTHLCLIPKIPNPGEMPNLRPISLCSVLYKVISKVIVKRLQPFLSQLVSESQSAFVSERLISDNIIVAHELVHALRTHPTIANDYLAVKSDMSKAYDRVEWQYVRALLKAMGFHSKWIEWVMSCITSVTFSVLINDHPHGMITPQRGLRQGDPMSPFLFVLCTEGLSHLINKAEMEGGLNGISFGPEGPTVNHLLFADDSLFMCKATVEQCKVLKLILERYGQVTGQEINVQKSSITFGDNVELNKKTEIREIFQIFNEGGAGTYLGLPECFSGSKVELFNYIKDKLKDRMSGWFAKTLSQGGKEILLKAVALAMPIYAMSCFRLPKTVCANLISAMIQLWWSSSEHTRKIPWVSWERMTLSKELGGIGFKDLDLFNQALLSKQAWRVLTEPASLVSRLLKSRYFYDGDFLQAKVGIRPSFAWKSILFGRELLVKGVEQQVGDGESIKLWTDPWMKDENGINRAPWRKNISFDVMLRVQFLIDKERNVWKEHLLNELFFPDDVIQILKIRLSRNRKDSWIWKFNKSGDFTVKSAYWLACQAKSSDIVIEARNQPSLNPLKALAWKTQTEPKIKTFLWKALCSALSVEDGLALRGIKVDGRCQICGHQGESINHVLFDCTFARQVWALSNVPRPREGFDKDSVYANYYFLVQWGKSSMGNWNMRRNWPWVIWNIWKRRNQFLFDHPALQPQEVVEKSIEEADLWFFALSCDNKREMEVEVLSEVVSTSKWRKPVNGWMKCNIGIFWCKYTKLAGAAWVLRNDNGEVLLHSRRVFSLIPSLDEARWHIFAWAVAGMQAHRINIVVFALGDKLLVDAVNKPRLWPAFRAHSDYLLSLLSSFSLWKVSLESKGSNAGATRIAGSVSSPHHQQSYVSVGAPDWLDELFAAEAL